MDSGQKYCGDCCIIEKVCTYHVLCFLSRVTHVHLIISNVHNDFIDFSIDHSEDRHTAVCLIDLQSKWQDARGLDGIERFYSMPVDT